MKPQVLYLAWIENRLPKPFARLVESGSFSCILLGVDRKVEKETDARFGGSSTADMIVVDLGRPSAERVATILARDPRMEGKLFIVSATSRTTASTGSTMVNVDNIVELLKACGGVSRPR